MSAEKVRDKLIEEITGHGPGHTQGLVMGFVVSSVISLLLGAAIYVGVQMDSGGDFSPGGMIMTSLMVLVVLTGLGAVGDKMGFLDTHLDMSDYRDITRDEEDILADFGIRSFNYEQRRESEAATAGCAVAFFQFLCGTLWKCISSLVNPKSLPHDLVRASTGILMFLQKSGLCEQGKLTESLLSSGLPKTDTRAGLVLLKQRGYISLGPKGFSLTEKGNTLVE